jgi:hypothetical protein
LETAAGPVPQADSATTEKLAAVPPASPVSVTLRALLLVAIDAPFWGPLASRTTYAIIALPFPDAADQLITA